MYDPGLTEAIIKEVMRRIGMPSKRALALFTGGTGGFHQALLQLHLLEDEGWQTDVLLTKGAQGIHGEETLGEAFDGFRMYPEDSATQEICLSDYDLVMIPVLTMNTASKIALGIADTPSTYLISRVLLEGIPVIAAKDACRLPTEAAGVGVECKPARVYQSMLQKHLETIRTYGVDMVPCGELAASALAACSPKSLASEKVQKRIITKEDVVQAKKDGMKQILIASPRQVTVYAREIAEELGVDIQCI